MLISNKVVELQLLKCKFVMLSCTLFVSPQVFEQRVCSCSVLCALKPGLSHVRSSSSRLFTLRAEEEL